MALYTPLGVRLTPYCKQYPEPPQEAFLSLDCLEALYGGAAGGGKSSMLLTAALQYVDVPGYAALLLRRNFTELSKAGGLIDRSKEWLKSTDASWNQNDHRWTFPSGAILEFGHLLREDTVYDYGSTEYQCIGFDELTEFTERQFVYMLSRLRRPSDPCNPLSRVPLRARGASNPNGRGKRWVKRRFVDRKPDPDDPEDTPAKRAARIFIPAKLGDNPHVDQDSYREALAQLDPETRAQLLDGRWDVREPGAWVFDEKALTACMELGAIFDRLLKAGRLPAPVDSRIATGVDYGDFATVQEVIYPLERGGIYIPPGEVETSRSDLEVISNAFIAAAKPYTKRPVWWAEHRYDASFAQSNRTFAKLAERRLGKHNPVKRTGRPATRPVSFGKSKDLTIRYLRLLMRRTLEAKEAGWPEGQAMTRVLAISPTNELLCEQLPEYQEGEDGKPVKGNDDAIDALIAGAEKPAKAHRKVIDAQAAKAAAGGNRELAERFSRAR